MKKNVTSALLFLYCMHAHAQHPRSAADSAVTDSIDISQPVFGMINEVPENDADPQEISSLLQSSPDVFARFSSFHFTAARFRQRGLPSENYLVTINGVRVNDPETGAAGWTSWGGLNDVTRMVESRAGIFPGRYGFSGVGGYSNIDAGASAFKRNIRVSYSAGNRIFRHRLMVTYATGLMRNGWAFCFSASSRSGDEVQIPGTYFRGQSYFFAADRKVSRRDLLKVIFFATPVEQGRTSPATAQAYELAGTSYYNSSWGYQNGRKRNASVSTTTRPVLLLSHVRDNHAGSTLASTLYYSFGRATMSGLNWSDAPNPKPDYYRYLPGYYYLKHDTAGGNQIKQAWNNEATRQIKFDDLININRNNLYTDPHLAGQGINTQEKRSRYILEDQVEFLQHGRFNVIYNRRMRNTFVSAGINADLFSKRRYKEIRDLLGGTFWLDVDQFAEGLAVEEQVMQNDIDQPNRKVRAGEKFGYDYTTHVRKAEIWLQAEHSWRRLDGYFAVSSSCLRVWREGAVANGKFPHSSKGPGQKLDFVNGGLKAGCTWKFSGRQFLSGNVLILSRAPELTNLYISPRVRHDIIPGPQNETVRGGDLSYHVMYPRLRMKCTFYNTVVRNQVWMRTYWHDEYNTNVNLIMSGVQQHHQGVELGIEKDLFRKHTVQLIIGYGEFFYEGRPLLDAWQDNNASAIFTGREVFLNNYRIGGMPQTIAGAGYRFTGRKSWYFSLSLDYAARIYVQPNPDRRTREATAKYTTGEAELAQQVVAQQQLPSYYFVNVLAGKSFRIARKYFLQSNISVNNLLNRTDIMVSGYEQMRWDHAELEMFPPKYSYMNGISLLLSISLNLK